MPKINERDKRNPEVREELDAENQYAEVEAYLESRKTTKRESKFQAKQQEA